VNSTGVYLALGRSTENATDFTFDRFTQQLEMKVFDPFDDCGSYSYINNFSASNIRNYDGENVSIINLS
jgi:hypothetical protein